MVSDKQVRQIEAVRYDGLIYLKRDRAWAEIVGDEWSADQEMVQATRALDESWIGSKTWPSEELDECDPWVDVQADEWVGGTEVKHLACGSYQDLVLAGRGFVQVDFWVDPVGRLVHRLAMRMTVEISEQRSMYWSDTVSISRQNQTIRVENPGKKVP